MAATQTGGQVAGQAQLDASLDSVSRSETASTKFPVNLLKKVTGPIATMTATYTGEPSVVVQTTSNGANNTYSKSEIRVEFDSIGVTSNGANNTYSKAATIPIQEPPNAASITVGNASPQPKLVKIDLIVIEDEIHYWETVVVCFVVGANPSLRVIDGFVRKIWNNLDIDIVGMVDKGVYLVTMKSIESRDKAYESNGALLDNKPFVTKPWTPEILTDKSSLCSMHV